MAAGWKRQNLARATCDRNLPQFFFHSSDDVLGLGIVRVLIVLFIRRGESRGDILFLLRAQRRVRALENGIFHRKRLIVEVVFGLIFGLNGDFSQLLHRLVDGIVHHAAALIERFGDFCGGNAQKLYLLENAEPFVGYGFP
jgi:hypothetical protein